MNEAANVVVGGTYRHVHGGLYRVVCLAKNSVSLKTEVIYEDDREKWSCPIEVFCKVKEGKPIFEFVGVQQGYHDVEDFYKD